MVATNCKATAYLFEFNPQAPYNPSSVKRGYLVKIMQLVIVSADINKYLYIHYITPPNNVSLMQSQQVKENNNN